MPHNKLLMYNIADIEKITGGKFLLSNNSAAVIEHLLIDSRKLLFPSSTVFFTLAGPRRQGHAFVKDLYSKGVRSFIIDATFIFLPQDFEGANIIDVKNVLQALQQLTAYHRNQFAFPVIGITGSNGKTMVKEWLCQLLQNDFNIVRSPKSYNSQIGVPLSVWQMNTNNTLGIFEAGISQPDEMQQLAKIIAPNIGVFTSIGEAHGEGFLNIRQKINEKLKNRPELDPLGSARQYAKRGEIKSQKTFNEVTEKVFNTLNEEFNYFGLVPITKIKEVLKDRVSKNDLNEMLLNFHDNDKHQLIGHGTLPIPPELVDGEVKTALGSRRHYIMKVNS